jgi:hypothetical protein
MGATIVKDDRTNMNRFKHELLVFKRSYVKVGILESAPMHTGEGESSATPMVMIGNVHEFGCVIKVTDAMRGKLRSMGIYLKKETTEVRIPERSFLRSWADENKEKIAELIGVLYDGVAQGTFSAKVALSKLGAAGVGGVRAQFRTNSWEPLKFREGLPLTGPTGQLINSIHYEVVYR